MERKERLNEKYGWVVFLGLGLLWLVVGLTQIFNPEGLTDNEAQHIIGMSLSELEASFPGATELVRFLYGTVGVLKTSWSLFSGLVHYFYGPTGREKSGLGTPCG